MHADVRLNPHRCNFLSSLTYARGSSRAYAFDGLVQGIISYCMLWENNSSWHPPGGIMQVLVCMCMYECGAGRAELHAGAGRPIAGVDGYMPWLTAAQIEHSTYAGHPAFSRYYCRQPWIKGVS